MGGIESFEQYSDLYQNSRIGGEEPELWDSVEMTSKHARPVKELAQKPAASSNQTIPFHYALKGNKRSDSAVCFIAKKPDAQPAPPTTGQLQGDQALFTVDASSLEAQAAAPARKARSKPRATNKQSNVTDKYPNIVAPPVFKGGADDFLRQSPLSAPQLYWHILQLSTTLIATIGAYMSLDAIIFDLRSFNLPYYTYGIHLHATAFMLFDLCYHLHCAKDALQDKERIEVYAKEACFMKLWEGTEKMVRIVYDCVPPDGKQVGPQDRDRIRTCWEECTILREGNGKKNSVGWSKCWDLPK